MKTRVIVLLGLSMSFLIGTFTLRGGLTPGSLMGLEFPDILRYWTIPLLLSLSCSLFSILLKRKPPTKIYLVVVTLLSEVLLIGGYVVLIFSIEAQDSKIAAMCCSAIMTGIGYGQTLLIWQHFLSKLKHEEVVQTLLLSLALGSAGYFLPLLVMQRYVYLAYPFLVLILGILCLLAIKLCATPKEEQSFFGKKASAVKKVLLELRDPLICVSAIAFVVTLTRTVALDGISNPGMVNLFDNISIVAVSLTLYFILSKLSKRETRSRRLNILGVYLVSFPLIATALLVLTIVGTSLSLIVTVLVNTVFSLVTAFMMSTSIIIARKHQLWPPYLYGILAGFIHIVLALATPLLILVYYPGNLGSAAIPVLALTVLYILAMSYVLLHKRRKQSATSMQEVATSSANNHSEEQAASPSVVDEVAQRCSILAKQNKLTAREVDILLLMAKGRDVPSISKHLFISENTVRSHSKGVYRKLGVHSKQELLDLVEDTVLV